MFAVVKIGGSQYRVNVGDKIRTDKIDAEIGSEVKFDNVLMLGEGEDLQIGTPSVEGGFVKAIVTQQARAKKVLVVKFKRRKGYRRKNGHRQHFTGLEIIGLGAGE